MSQPVKAVVNAVGRVAQPVIGAAGSFINRATTMPGSGNPEQAAPASTPASIQPTAPAQGTKPSKKNQSLTFLAGARAAAGEAQTSTGGKTLLGQ